MGIPVFDTFEISQGFEKVYFPKEEVAALTKALASVRSDPEAVSKAEIKSNAEKHESKVLQAIFELRKDNELLRKDMGVMEDRFNAKFEMQRKDIVAIDSKMEILKRDIILRLGGMVLASSGLVIAMLKLLLPH